MKVAVGVFERLWTFNPLEKRTTRLTAMNRHCLSLALGPLCGSILQGQPLGSYEVRAPQLASPAVQQPVGSDRLILVFIGSDLGIEYAE